MFTVSSPQSLQSARFICNLLPQKWKMASSQRVTREKTGVWKCHPRCPSPAVQVISGLIDAWGSAAWTNRNRLPVPVFHLWQLYKRSLWSPLHINVPSLAYITLGITDRGGMTHDTGGTRESGSGSSSPVSEQPAAFLKAFPLVYTARKSRDGGEIAETVRL